MFSRDNLFFAGIFVLMTTVFMVWGFNYLADNHTLFIIATLFGVFMAFNIGGNDVANSFGTSVGAKTLTVKQALMIASIFELGGAMLAGAAVTDTIRKGIVDISAMDFDPMLFVFVMMGSLLSAGTWLLYASRKGYPVSTTHAIVGGILGGSIALGYVTMQAGESVFGLVHWDQITKIAISWVVSPILGGMASYGIYWYLKRNILDYNDAVEAHIDSIKDQLSALKASYNEATASSEEKTTYQNQVHELNRLKKKQNAFYALRTHAPIAAAFGTAMIAGMLLFKGLKHAHLDLDDTQIFVLLAVLSTLMYGVVYAIIKVMHKDTPHKATMRVFSMLQVLTASSFAFSHGANDIANAIGPFAAIIDILATGKINTESPVPIIAMATFGVALVAGLWFIGKEVIDTVGSRITEIFPVTGFAAELGATLVILLATKMGIPVSSTHILVGAIIGIGMLNRNANWALMRPIAMAWVITLPASAAMAAIFFFILKILFGY
ncbi:MAG: inorganic phosphate transporter [Sulfuricurvum sp.]|uniref:inorganic phosphate transporter n=1 Tax=Sulfuricurvum sp. TaxID=2025608 RepID=UPI00260A12B5|nr:inorganic phosphate transporter [Sulfuricurvum sp.]MDD2368997.1 inorganic phosphate transporter [Sulfuricurvum sp.]MDD5117354.1 inorganic phosphate transporter [Sulfuricurvum sp.]